MKKYLISTTKNWISENLIFVIFLLTITSILVIRALPDNHMDMASAQSMLETRWWVRDGFLTHYFLGLNAGYGKIVKYFDESELNSHAQGTVAGGLIGNKIYYTHYPSFYIIPMALLVKFGVEKLFFIRLLPILASILALIFFYKFTNLITSKVVAFLAVLYFSISGIFIRWADSLEYIPYEDFWRFLILFLSIILFKKLISSGQSLNLKKIKWHIMGIWFAYFLLSLTSFNSTFFIFVWLTGLAGFYLYKSERSHKMRDFIMITGIIGLAPVVGFAIQLIQNVAYLGWHNTVLDLRGALHTGNSAGLGFKTRFEGIIRPFFSMTSIINFYTTIMSGSIGNLKKYIWQSSIQTIYILPILVLFFVPLLIKIRNFISYKIPKNFLILLFTAPLFQTFVLPMTGYRDNMGRLTAPIIGIFIGIIAEGAYVIFKEKFKDLQIIQKLALGILFALIASLFIIQILTAIYYPKWIAYAPLSNSDINFTKDIKNVLPGEKATFMINEGDTKIPEETLLLRTPAALIDPTHYNTNYIIWEYYLDMPLLNFTKTSYLIRDLLFLEKQSEYPFTAIVTSDNESIIDELYKKIKSEKLPISAIKTAENRYYFLVSPLSKK